MHACAVCICIQTAHRLTAYDYARILLSCVLVFSLPALDFEQEAIDVADRCGPPHCYFSPRESQFLKDIITKHGSDYDVS